MTHMTVEMEVLMARMLTPAPARAWNILPAMPGRQRKSGPKMPMLAAWGSH